MESQAHICSQRLRDRRAHSLPRRWTSKRPPTGAPSRRAPVAPTRDPRVPGYVQVSFVHDPQQGNADAGTTVKTFRLAPAPDGRVFFLNLEVRSNGGLEKLSLPLSVGEATVMHTCMSYLVPRMLGFDLMASTLVEGLDGVGMRAGADDPQQLASGAWGERPAPTAAGAEQQPKSQGGFDGVPRW